MSQKTLHAPVSQGTTAGTLGAFFFDGQWFQHAADYNALKAEGHWATYVGIPPAASESLTSPTPHLVGN